MKNNHAIYICSDARSGSTLLDMLLGRHPALTSVGEIHHLYAYLNGKYFRQQNREDTCACEKKITECSFWSQVISHYESNYKTEAKNVITRFPMPSNLFIRYLFDFFVATVSISNLANKINKAKRFTKYKQIAANRFRLYETINNINNTSFVVDSSKKIEGLKFLVASNPESVKVIFLIRDLRAIATSKFKRQAGSKLSVMMLQTMLFHIKLFLTVKTIPKEKRVIINYEDLIVNPYKYLKQIFLFSGIDAGYESDFESYCESHVLGGSPHRLTNKKLRIFVDNKWKETITFFHQPLSKILVLTQKVFNIKAS